MRIFVLGDLHLPWPSWTCLKLAAKFVKQYNPDLIVQVGDFIDAHSWSRFPRMPFSPSAEQEWQMVEKATAKLHAMFPEDLNWYILEGNHDRRLQMRAFEVQLPGQLTRPLSELFPFANWKWHVHQRPLVVDGVSYIHGDEIAGKHARIAEAIGRSVVHGHHHKDASIAYADTFDRQVWTMNVGCAFDQESVAAYYAKKSVMRSWIGWATVTDGLPQLYPLRLMQRSVR